MAWCGRRKLRDLGELSLLRDIAAVGYREAILLRRVALPGTAILKYGVVFRAQRNREGMTVVWFCREWSIRIHHRIYEMEY